MPEPPREEPLNAELLTWSALLSQCVRLAQAAVALPDDSSAAGTEGRAWRASVPHVIRLQAVWFALERRDELPVDERALGRDRAAVALRESGSALEQIWAGAGLALPEGIASLKHDVHAAITQAG
ncbi:MAG: hypothetical protein AAGF84_01450 [Planctomycetota bacterium]